MLSNNSGMGHNAPFCCTHFSAFKPDANLRCNTMIRSHRQSCFTRLRGRAGYMPVCLVIDFPQVSAFKRPVWSGRYTVLLRSKA